MTNGGHKPNKPKESKKKNGAKKPKPGSAASTLTKGVNDKRK